LVNLQIGKKAAVISGLFYFACWHRAVGIEAARLGALAAVSVNSMAVWLAMLFYYRESVSVM
tara:strand:- start:1006 stop:1191 length:186 start_codon:yes stop_codon:yes gene_type:complete